MSGWHPGDKFMEENTGDSFPAVNNITVYGYLPSDEVPSPSNFVLHNKYDRGLKNIDGSSFQISQIV